MQIVNTYDLRYKKYNDKNFNLITAQQDYDGYKSDLKYE